MDTRASSPLSSLHSEEDSLSRQGTALNILSVSIYVYIRRFLATWRINLYVGEMLNYGQLVGGKLGGQYKIRFSYINQTT